ncbi:heparinase II/III family protein [uncultured Pseudokineococcus sp.]|uniref:heparinase II/III domain-containing protein n=1 Tax=uncultured Pseudokineococcus sp. TaxID=1642928 RepID=UPI002605C138|nr:heparinase II/III family protein [uncultured Pseudokineococcus sp.]
METAPHLDRTPRTARERPAPRTVLRAVLALVVGAVVLTPASADAAATVRVGSCSLPADASMQKLVASGEGRAALVIGPEDMAWARTVEARATTTASSPEGVRTRQQLKFADAALSAPLPTAKNLSLGARASAERMLRLRYAQEVVADGRSPALAEGTTPTSSATYARRVADEVLAWSKMPSWGASTALTADDSLLEAAEVGTTVALGYSLVADRLSGAQRAQVLDALTRNLLAPACAGWNRGIWMTESRHNWGVIVNSGAVMAAMVVAERDEALAGAVVKQALPRANRATSVSGGDGGSFEGPNYAVLSHRYLAYLSASMTLSYGEGGRRLVQAVPDAARYYLHSTGPSGRPFTYSDSDGALMMPWLPLWNARHGGDPLGDWLGQQRLAQSHPDTLLLLWTRPATTTPAAAEAPRRTFPRSGVATLRSSWAKDATWVGVKGGWNSANHSHLDLGSLVLDANGRRFVDDPGQDSYSLPGYLSGANRFGYWRRSTAGHSTLARAGVNQPAGAAAAVTAPQALSGGRAMVGVDTTSALQAMSARREVTMQGEVVTVKDTSRFAKRTSLRWKIQTQAAVRLERGGRSAVLTIDGQSLEVRLGSSTPGAFRVRAAPAAPAGGVSTSGWRSVDLDLTTWPASSGTTAAGIVVSFIPR